MNLIFEKFRKEDIHKYQVNFKLKKSIKHNHDNIISFVEDFQKGVTCTFNSNYVDIEIVNKDISYNHNFKKAPNQKDSGKKELEKSKLAGKIYNYKDLYFISELDDKYIIGLDKIIYIGNDVAEKINEEIKSDLSGFDNHNNVTEKMFYFEIFMSDFAREILILEGEEAQQLRKILVTDICDSILDIKLPESITIFVTIDFGDECDQPMIAFPEWK